MRKLKLNLEQLAVESFQTASAGDATGTVRGAAYAEEITEPSVITEPIPTDTIIITIRTCQTACNQITCGGTCGVTCATCDDPTCNSCFVTRCWTGHSPECCA